MQLELAADHPTAALIARLKPLLACRDGRPRIQAVKTIWHDSPDHQLLAKGLCLAEQRDQWRLERLLPGARTWLPAQPPPVLHQAETPAGLPDLPDSVAALAAFDGRRTTSIHLFGASPVTLTIEKGILRAVTAERPVARVTLSGEPQAVHQAAMLIAETADVFVPTTSLAAEAIALATGQPARPRHDGAPVLPEPLSGESLTVTQALAHILGHLTDVILAQAGQVQNGPEGVHQMRVAVRRARSALSVFRDALPPGTEETVKTGLKALGTQLGPIRDWDVFADETTPAVQHALPGDERLGRLAAAANRRRRDCQKALTAYLASADFRRIGIELAWFTAAVTIEPEIHDRPPLDAFASQVLQIRWKKLVSSGKRMQDLDIPALHSVRLRAKQTRYAAEMFASLHQGKAASRFIRRLSVLQQRLGVLNDGAVASNLLDQLGGPGGRHAYAAGVVTGFMAARAQGIRPGIIEAFERFRRQPGFWT